MPASVGNGTSGDGSPDEWLAHARTDLRAAALLRSDASLRTQACFHLQQGAEKALKAVLLSRGQGFPRTHNLRLLLDLLAQVEADAPPSVQEAVSLTPYAVETRYPGIGDAISDAEFASAQVTATATIDWAAGQIARSDSPPTE